MRESQTNYRDIHELSTKQESRLTDKKRQTNIFRSSNNHFDGKKRDRMLGLSSLDSAVEFLNTSG